MPCCGAVKYGAGQIEMSDTEELDRLRRQHAQRHGTASDNSRSGGKKSDNVRNESKDITICKFYNDSHCSRQDTHFTKGVWYYHICSKCRGSHKAKNCPSSKN